MPASFGQGQQVQGQMDQIIRGKISILKQKVQETGMELDKCRQEQEAFSVEYYAFRESMNRTEALVAMHGESHQDCVRSKQENQLQKKQIQMKYTNLREVCMETYFDMNGWLHLG